MRWPLQPLQPLQTTQLQPPFGPSVDLLCHPWFTTTHLSYRCPIFETSATAFCGTTGISTVCPIYNHICIYHLYIYIHNYILWPCISQQHSGHVYHNNQKLENQARLGDHIRPSHFKWSYWPTCKCANSSMACCLEAPLGYDESQKFWKVNHWKSQSILNVDLFDKCVEGW